MSNSRRELLKLHEAVMSHLLPAPPVFRSTPGIGSILRIGCVDYVLTSITPDPGNGEPCYWCTATIPGGCPVDHVELQLRI